MADLRLLPPGIADERSRAFLALIERLDGIDLTPLLVNRVDSVPTAALYALSWQFGVTGSAGWDVAISDQARRELLRRAIDVHRRKGTPYAIKEALRALGFPSVTINENFGGVWTDFQVVFGAPADAQPIPAARRALLGETIEAWKPARSRLVSTLYLSYKYDGTYSYNGDITHAGVPGE